MVLRAGIAAFVVALAVALALIFVLRDVSGVLRYIPSFAAWYLACAAWLTTTILLLRRPPDLRLGLWTVGGLLALAGTLVVLVIVARTGGGVDNPSAQGWPMGTAGRLIGG